MDLVQVLLLALTWTFASVLGQSIPASDNATAVSTFTLPSADTDVSARQAQVELYRQTILYGPSPLGNISFYPTGALGDAIVQVHFASFVAEAQAYRPLLVSDAQRAAVAAIQAGGLQDLEDYQVLYDGQWTQTNPDGVNPGYFSNYTQDLLFSMERLSLNPFPLVRLKATDELPFAVDDAIVRILTTKTLIELQESGRLFLVDYSTLSTYDVPPGKYSAACSAYFYLHPDTDDFLPLAIKTNVGADLIYTPLDDFNDWFLAKTLFESNENFYLACYHLGSTHGTAEIVYHAALRTLAEEHPIRGLLDRIMYRAYAIRRAGALLLFNVGGLFDQNFAFGAANLNKYGSELYHESGGYFQSTYFDTLFKTNGLIGCTYGPELPSFPFYEDVAPIHAVIKEFMTSVVESYYDCNEDLASDAELQAWIVEANGPAEVYDFPAAPLSQRDTLVEILTHLAYLAGVMHHALNTNSLADSWALPLHPTAHWAPLPTEKGIDSVMDYLPNLNQSISQISIEATFSRPNVITDDETLSDLFSDPKFLSATNEEVKNAAARFTAQMEELGAQQDLKSFDDQGLSQGMPFIFRNVNPRKVPFFLAI